MKLNRRRIDARIPNWLYSELMNMAIKRGWSFTEILEAAAEKGLNWYKKNWDKRNDVKSPEEPREEAGHDERRSNTHQKNDRRDEMVEQLKNSQEYQQYLKEVAGIDGPFWFSMFLSHITNETWDDETDPDGSKIMSKALEILDQKQTDISESSK